MFLWGLQKAKVMFLWHIGDMVCGAGYGTLGIRAGSLVWPRAEQ